MRKLLLFIFLLLLAQALACFNFSPRAVCLRGKVALISWRVNLERAKEVLVEANTYPNPPALEIWERRLIPFYGSRYPVILYLGRRTIMIMIGIKKYELNVDCVCREYDGDEEWCRTHPEEAYEWVFGLGNVGQCVTCELYEDNFDRYSITKRELQFLKSMGVIEMNDQLIEMFARGAEEYQAGMLLYNEKYGVISEIAEKGCGDDVGPIGPVYGPWPRYGPDISLLPLALGGVALLYLTVGRGRI